MSAHTETPGNGWIARRLDALERDADECEKANAETRKLSDKHEIELHGERGVYAAMKELSDKLDRNTRAQWALAMSILVASITLAMTIGFA